MIEVKNLVKKYGDFEAVRGVSFTVEEGGIYGFLGPNGAGKSTTMNIITGCLAATAGEVTIDGFDIYKDPEEAKSKIGYLPEQPPLYTDMTPTEYLTFVGRAKGLSGAKLHRCVDEIIKKTNLSEYKDRLIANLSKGYKQRVGIAEAIIGDPKVIILDEPTVGLDPRQIIEIRELIRSLGGDHTVILSSHILSEISAVCDYVIIMSKGKIAASDTLENLTKLYEGKNNIDIIARAEPEKIKEALMKIDGVLSVECEKTPEDMTHVRIASERECDVREKVFFVFAEMKYPIVSMEYEEVTLEKVFLELTGADNIENSNTKESTEKKSSARDSTDSMGDAEKESEDDDEQSSEIGNEISAGRGSGDKNDGGDDYTPLFGGEV